MGTATLFGDSDDLKAPATTPDERVVRELVDVFGVDPDLARAYGHRQAFAVLGRLRRRAAAAKTARPQKAAVPPARAARAGEKTDFTEDDAPWLTPPHRGGGSQPERRAAAAVLGQAVRDGAAGDELFRVLRGCLYVLADAELAWLAGVLTWVLNGEG